MIPSFTAVLASVAGKVAVGVIVATTSVGAAAAAGAQIPFVAQDRPPVEESTVVAEPAVEERVAGQPAGEPPAEEPAVDEVATEEVDEPTEGVPADPTHGEIVSAFTQSTELEGCEKGQATAAVARGDVVPGEDGTIDPAAVDAYLADSGKCLDDDDDGDAEADEEAEVDDGEGPANHGAVVSGFVHETELEGCAKGQATAAVARGDVVPGEDGTIDPAAVDAYLADSGKCLDKDDGEAEKVDLTKADPSAKGKPDHAGQPGKPDHAGQRGKPDHAGPPAGKGPNG